MSDTQTAEYKPAWYIDNGVIHVLADDGTYKKLSYDEYFNE